MSSAALEALRPGRRRIYPPWARGDASPDGDVERPVGRSVGDRIEAALGRWLLRAALAATMAVLPFYLLVRGALLATLAWGWHAWLAVAFGASLASLVLAGAGWWALRRLGFGRSVRGIATRAAFPIVALFCASCLLHLAGPNAKTDDIRAD